MTAGVVGFLIVIGLLGILAILFICSIVEFLVNKWRDDGRFKP